MSEFTGVYRSIQSTLKPIDRREDYSGHDEWMAESQSSEEIMDTPSIPVNRLPKSAPTLDLKSMSLRSSSENLQNSTILETPEIDEFPAGSAYALTKSLKRNVTSS